MTMTSCLALTLGAWYVPWCLGSGIIQQIQHLLSSLALLNPRSTLDSAKLDFSTPHPKIHVQNRGPWTYSEENLKTQKAKDWILFHCQHVGVRV